MSGYIGTQPVPQATQTRQTFTATASQTSFATVGYTPGFLDVYLNGVHLLNGTDYTASNGSDVVLTTGAAASDVLEVISYSTYEVNNQAFTGDFSVDTDTLYVDSTNNRVGIGTSSPATALDVAGTITSDGLTVDGQTATIQDATSPRLIIKDTTNNYVSEIRSINQDTFIQADPDNVVASSNMIFTVDGSEAMRITSAADLLVGKTNTGASTVGAELNSDGILRVARSGGSCIEANRTTSDGDIINLRKDNATVGSIGANGGKLYISNDTGTGGLRFYNGGVNPCDASGNESDNQRDFGKLTSRWDDIYATNGTIQTSDANEKQQIADLTAAEMDAAKAISKLFKTFKWNDAVAEKGDAARTHAGVIAQEVEAAMTAAGLNAGDYAFFISSTWWESTKVIPAVDEVLDEEGNVVTEAQPERTVTHTHDTQEQAPEGAVEKTRKGIRYPELMSFVGAATEQRLASIEARLDALETV